MPRRLRAAFYRGGTSKAVVFNGADLPADPALRDRIFLHVLGSPDAYGRQLDGMGGGLSSLSKVVIVQPSEHPEADVDYTFVQVGVREPVADYGSACGNMSSCVGPFAVCEGMVPVAADATEALVRIFDTNTRRLYHARFPVEGGAPVEEGGFTIPGVSGSGAAVALEFLAPGGAATGRLLPSGHPVDRLEIAGLGHVDLSLIDAANPVVFIRADVLDADITAPPDLLDADAGFMAAMERMRAAGAMAMGLADRIEAVAPSTPKVAIIGPPGAFAALDGTMFGPESHDLNIRLISMGNVHRAVTLTGAMCTAVAARIPGSLVAAMVSSNSAELRIGTPSGVLPVAAKVALEPSGPRAISASTFRTQRRIMEGAVLFPSGFGTGAP